MAMAQRKPKVPKTPRCGKFGKKKIQKADLVPPVGHSFFKTDCMPGEKTTLPAAKPELGPEIGSLVVEVQAVRHVLQPWPQRQEREEEKKDKKQETKNDKKET